MFSCTSNKQSGGSNPPLTVCTGLQETYAINNTNTFSQVHTCGKYIPHRVIDEFGEDITNLVTVNTTLNDITITANTNFTGTLILN